MLHNEKEGVIELSDHYDRQEIHDNVKHGVIRGQDDQVDRFTNDKNECLAETNEVSLTPPSELPMVVHRVLHH